MIQISYGHQLGSKTIIFVALFFLGCMAVAGLASAMTERKILFVQTVPALLAIGLLLV